MSLCIVQLWEVKRYNQMLLDIVRYGEYTNNDLSQSAWQLMKYLRLMSREITHCKGNDMLEKSCKLHMKTELDMVMEATPCVKFINR